MSTSPKRLMQTPPKKRHTPLLIAAVVVVAAAIILPVSGIIAPEESKVPAASVPPVSSLEPTVTPSPEPVPSPDPEPAVQPYDFTVFAPEREAVGLDYFSDALFIGDSRTEGLQMFGGVEGATFYCHRGLSVFGLEDRKVIQIDGSSYSVVEALGLRQFGKIYISLGVNELGYFNSKGFASTFRSFLEQVRVLQPDAVIYLQTIVPVNPEKCKSSNQPYYVTNEQVALYNAVLPEVAAEEQVVLLDVGTALSNESGILARENTSDGVHFTRGWYQVWLDYLMRHTVDEEAYRAGQTAPASQEGAINHEV